ncbi:MAG: hypothetical protein HQL32_08540 [Planctomycetes bacterium]|nr:hypothetical protein [Planctomycetota bacterium]
MSRIASLSNILWFFSCCLTAGLLWYGVVEARDHEAFADESSGVFRLEAHSVAPEWMPRTWHRNFFKDLLFDRSRPAFARDLHSVVEELGESPWVEEVKSVKRAYNGDVQLALSVRKPACLLKNNRGARYLDRYAKEMPLLSRSSYNKLLQLKDDRSSPLLPEVDVSALVNKSLSDSLRRKWLQEVVDFVLSWQQQDTFYDRLELKEIDMKPYESKAGLECLLTLVAVDLNFSKKVKINWGIHREYNELEDRYAKDKWQDLIRAIEQKKYFSSVDLRYKEPGVSF